MRIVKDKMGYFCHQSPNSVSSSSNLQSDFRSA